MKSNPKIKVITSITIGILLALSPPINNNLSFNAENCYKSTEYSTEINLDNSQLKISKASGKIHINNNWTDAKAAGLCTGYGTPSNPYVIEDLVIDGGGSGDCIRIENTDVYFRIENCTLQNSGDSGITIINVSKGQLINNSLHNLYFDISNNNTISRNKLYDHSGDGIAIWNSNDNLISENVVINIGWGMSLHSSDFNLILKNEVNNCSNIGIEVIDCSNNNISENKVYYNEHGICLFESDSNIILYNTINNNEIGIYIHDSKCNKILDNSFSGNIIDIQGTQQECPPFPFFEILIEIMVYSIVVIVIAITGIILIYKRRKKLEM